MSQGNRSTMEIIEMRSDTKRTSSKGLSEYEIEGRVAKP